jgi:hypothetical protein
VPALARVGVRPGLEVVKLRDQVSDVGLRDALAGVRLVDRLRLFAVALALGGLVRTAVEDVF